MHDLLAYSFLGIIVLFGLWPFGYICLKRGKNRCIFILSAIGITFCIALLVQGMLSPFGLFAVKILPQLEEIGIIGFEIAKYIRGSIDVVVDWYWIILMPVYIILPPLLARRYEIFGLTSKCLGQPCSTASPFHKSA